MVGLTILAMGGAMAITSLVMIDRLLKDSKSDEAERWRRCFYLSLFVILLGCFFL